MKPGIRIIAAALMMMLVALPARSDCRQALALGLDVSGSVDAREYKLQLHGLANALQNPDVVQAFLATPQRPVSLLVYEWSGRNYQAVLLSWTDIQDAQVLATVAEQLRGLPLRIDYNAWVTDPSTAIGSTMVFGATLLADQPCDLRTLDLSGDGISNSGPRPRDVKPDLEGAGITVNTLAIAPRVPDPSSLSARREYKLTTYFEAEVILGPGAFSETAFGFEDFEAAMIRKLLREVAAMVIGQAGMRDRWESSRN